jgi:hypothetical protein
LYLHGLTYGGAYCPGFTFSPNGKYLFAIGYDKQVYRVDLD